MTRKGIIQAAYRKFAEADRIWSANLKKERKSRKLPMSYRRGMIRFLEPHRD